MGAPGFDDAPLCVLPKSKAPKSITFVVPYYENPNFLAKQIQHWAAYPVDVRDRLSIVLVDDGSPEHPAAIVVGRLRDLIRAELAAFRLFRIGVDVRWNWLAARNIGAQHAPLDAWIVFTDIDHVVSADVARALMNHDHSATVIYRFLRRESSGERIHPHPNSFFCTRSTFWHVGGYDEALSGHYGTDGDWRRRCAAAAKIRTLPLELIRHEHEGDSSTTRYKRKQPEDAGKKKIIAARGKNWRPKVLSFPYHEVEV